MDPAYSKFHLIDENFLIYTSEFDVREDTKINADNSVTAFKWEEWKKNQSNLPNPNFVTEIFFTTLFMAHYGFMSAQKYCANLEKEINEIRKHVNRMRQQQTSSSWAQQDPRILNSYNAQLKTFEKQLDELIGQKLAMHTGLLGRSTLDYVMRFYNLVIILLIKSASGCQKKLDFASVVRGSVDNNDIPLFPLPCNIPMNFATLPEWIIEDICEFFLFIARYL